MTHCSENKLTRSVLLGKILKLGPLAATAYFLLVGLVLITLFRGLFVITYFERISLAPNFLWLFIVGIRMDLIVLCQLAIFPTVILLIFVNPSSSLLKRVVAAVFTIFLIFVLYMEMATFPFLDEYDVRPDQKFLEYLKHVREVTTMMLKSYLIELLLGFVVVTYGIRLFWRRFYFLVSEGGVWKARKTISFFPIIAALLFLGARSSVGRRPANPSTAHFSDNHLVNELALNSAYSVLYSAYRMFRHERNPSMDYGRMSQEEVFRRIKQDNAQLNYLEGSQVPFLHLQDSPFVYDRPLNIVIILQESMGASDVGCLSGPPITPNLCRLKDEGLWLSNLYATGTRTARGIEAVVSGFLPTSAVAVPKLGLARNGFFTIAALLEKHGYSTDFIYGGMSHFDEMRSFFLGNGFQAIHDEPTYENPVFVGTWGVSDEDLVRKANDVYVKYGDKPFFSLILSTSNHLPYEFPDGRIELYENPKQTHYNAIKYADCAIGLFFELAKKEEYFKNTLFLIVADHNSQVRGNEHVPIDKYHIPGLIIGPGVPKQELSVLASQVDLLPTLMHFSGLDSKHSMIGRNLFTLSKGDPGRAFMQFGSNNAYRVGDSVVINRPFMEPEQYTYQGNKLIRAPLDSEMSNNALAYAHLPWLLYSKRLYRVE